MMAAQKENPLARLWARLRANGRRPEAAITALRSTEFWCEKHWDLVERLGVDPFIATRNVAYGLAMVGERAHGRRHACCLFDDSTLARALELFRE